MLKLELGQNPGAFGFHKVSDLWRPYGVQCLQLTSDLTYASATGRIRVRVPAGTVYDGASIPNWGWPMLRSVNAVQLLLPAAVHDYGYRRLTTVLDCETGLEVRLEREQYDDLLREGCLARRAPAEDASVIRYAVGIGGWMSWEKKSADWLPADGT